MKKGILVLSTICALAFGVARATEPCLVLPPSPNNAADGLVTVTYDSNGVLIGVPPENSLFTVDIQPAGLNGAPTPPIPAQRYAAWCFDVATDIDTTASSTMYGGKLYSSCDPTVAFNAYLPASHPHVIQDAAHWHMINYLINHRANACNGLVPTMWEVQLTIFRLFDQPFPPTPPYPTYRPEVVDCLYNSTVANAPTWQLGCTDKVAVIFDIDANWDALAPDVQLIFLEVPNKGGPELTVSSVTSCSQVVKYDASLFTSPCGSITSVTFSPASGWTFPFGSSPVAYTVTDSAGNTATGVFTVTVTDNDAPVITPVADIDVNADAGTCKAVVTYATTALDCNLASLTFSPASGSLFPIGPNLVTITATDTATHVSTSTFTVTVHDVTPPMLAVTNITTNAAPDVCNAPVSFAATATDCSPVTIIYSLYPGFSPTISSGAIFPVGTTTVYVKATDLYGNAAQDSFTVTVKDTQPPKLTSPLNDITLNVDVGECYATFNYTPTAVDNCDGAITVSMSPASGTHLAAGTTTTVVITATDSNGNSKTWTFNVTVGACLPPGLKIEKTVSNASAAPFQAVTYSYKVTNTGGTILTNIVVTDDNGTPSYTGDDFTVGTIASLMPGASATLTAQVIPVVCETAVVNGGSISAGTAIVVILPNGDVKVTYLQSFNVNDNTYGTGQIGWPGGNKKFSQLVGSDHLEFRFMDKTGKVIIDFYCDYVSATPSVTIPGTGQVLTYASGYGSKGPFGGDGSMVTGNANNVVTFSTSITDDLNRPGNVPFASVLTVDSPTSLVGGNVVINTGVAPAGWDVINSYTVVIKGSAFGTAGFGSVSFPDLHNSPSKNGCNEIYPKPGCCSVTNKATGKTGDLTASATATVNVCQAPPPPNTGCIGSLVWIDKDGDGLQDAGEPGLPGITVTLKNSSGVVIGTDVTDGSGVYGFTGLAAGTYTVVVATPSGYTPSPKTVGTNRSIDSNGSPATVVLATNSTCDDTIDFGFKPSTPSPKCLLTYTQGGWGSEPKGNNPGALLSKKFGSVYPLGFVKIGSGLKVLVFTSANAVAAFLPQGGKPDQLDSYALNPRKTAAGEFAGQLLALQLNVDFSNAGLTATGLGGMKLASGPLAGKSVNDVLNLANSVISGGALPGGMKLSDLNDVLTAINENYDNGTNNDGYLK